jgi:hypothetical protein
VTVRVTVEVVVVLEMVVTVQTRTPRTFSRHGVVVVTMGVGSATTLVTSEVTSEVTGAAADDAAELAALTTPPAAPAPPPGAEADVATVAG